MEYLYLDLETFYPYPDSLISVDIPQPIVSDPNVLRRRQKRGLAHPYAKDPRRCALRFITIQSGDTLRSHDMFEGPVPKDFRQLIATSTLVGHNLDFDVNVLRRYGV